MMMSRPPLIRGQRRGGGTTSMTQKTDTDGGGRCVPTEETLELYFVVGKLCTQPKCPSPPYGIVAAATST